MIVKVYVDGACSGNPGPGGWAVIMCCKEHVAKYSGHEDNTTNNRMELMAVVKAIEVLIDEHYENDQIEIYSDSAYVINAIEKGWLANWMYADWQRTVGGDVKNTDLWKQLLGLMTKTTEKSIKFVKIKGHSGNTFNEAVDKLAKLACERGKQNERSQAN